MHIISQMKLGVPQKSREAFTILSENKVIDEELAVRLKGMIGSLNIAVHDYQALNLNILKKIIEKHLDDFKVFTHIVVKLD